MDFLRKEFEGLPEEYIRIALKELESIIRASRLISSESSISDNLQAIKLTMRINSLLNFTNALRKDIQDASIPRD